MKRLLHCTHVCKQLRRPYTFNNTIVFKIGFFQILYHQKIVYDCFYDIVLDWSKEIRSRSNKGD